MSIQAYQQAAQRAETPRETEYRAFAVATRALVEAKERGRLDIGGLAEALTRNRRLWTTLAIDCAQPGNQLPGPLRAQIISLAAFVDRHSSAVLRDKADLDVLIDVNRSIMEGLAGR